MDIRQLEYFVTIVEEGGITKAAKRLFMAQPPLTRQLQQIEKELGVKLFDRSNKKNIFLTPAGKLLFNKAKRILYDIDEIITEVQEFNHGMSSTISIGTTIYASEILLLILKNFLQKYPMIIPEIYEGDNTHLINLLNNHTVDIIIASSPHDTNRYNVKKLQSDKCVLVVSGDLKWNKESISLEEISCIPLVLLNTPDSNSLYRKITNEFENRKLKMNISCVSHDSGLLLKMITNNFGATILPESMINVSLKESVKIIPIINNPWITTPNLIWRNEDYVSSTIKEFIKIVDLYCIS